MEQSGRRIIIVPVAHALVDISNVKKPTVHGKGNVHKKDVSKE